MFDQFHNQIDQKADHTYDQICHDRGCNDESKAFHDLDPHSVIYDDGIDVNTFHDHKARRKDQDLSPDVSFADNDVFHIGLFECNGRMVQIIELILIREGDDALFLDGLMSEERERARIISLFHDVLRLTAGDDSFNEGIQHQ